MIIKTYIVNSETEAYPMIFHDLGAEAFILNTKQIKTGGFFGLFRKKQVEVVAAADHFAEKSTQVELAVEVEKPSKDTQNEVLKELSEMKGLISTIVRDEKKAIPTAVEKWVRRLREQEVDEEVIEYIIKKINKIHVSLQNLSAPEIEQVFLEIIEQLFEEGKAIETGSSSSLITLLGPTGVGKTTTIAKLAAARVFQQRQKVGLLTTDTYRIAAVEQLKTYAGILNIPLEVVANPDDLQKSMEALKGCQMVFMDSAGRNYLEDEYIEEINTYLHNDAPQENYLVLSMTTRWRDMRKIVDQMKSVPIDKLILTKWDETSCYGVALNMVYHYPYPLSYLSFGQGVPQDIMLADPLFMAKKILGVDENESGSSIPIKTII
ncbi:flagellar biosynthesis protein FlhF [Neobacillus niacini]|uniref:flagellar biosynthesis protein FlhF n=1 Tax=Neobacillus niacini TaxID=86668 RepID=UPI00285BA48A|nr:flagellar biosynthesis protein FlhF [Neobacillus niacini]MDR7080052.1 flagellar biosynthesis protein FlhF [Neobacillus niacini]